MKYLAVLLCGLLVLVAIGRFRAEAEVRHTQRDIEALEQEADDLSAEIERVRLEVEVLENAGRLSKLNSSKLALGTVRAEQLLDDRGFAEVIGLPMGEVERLVPEGADVIGNAIGMADPILAEKVVQE